MSGREREVVLEGPGPPWGFRITGGADTLQDLKISRVNPGSVAAERVREGDMISCINGQDSRGLTNQEAKTILNTLNDKLTLKLHNKRGCGEDQKKKKIETKNISTPVLTSPILAVSIDQARLPLPCSPEYIILRKSREKKRSGSLSSLPDCSLLTGSMSVSSEEDSSSASTSTSESSSRSERQTAWLRSLKQTKTTKTKMKIIKKMLERDYESEPETELSLDQQLEYYVNLATSNLPTQKHSKPSKSNQPTPKRTGKIENFECDEMGGISPRISDNKEKESDGSQEPQTKYLHQILAEGGRDQILTVRKAGGQEREEDGRSVYRTIMSGGDIPTRGLASTTNMDCDSRSGSRSDCRTEYTEEKINIHYKTVVRSQVKEELPEEVLDKVLEEKMLNVYREMERKKKEKVEEDTERRRHGDNFLLREKNSVISQYRQLEQQQARARKQPGLRLKARALFSFVAETERELSFQAGNVLTVTGDVDDNWLRGELAGRTGIFPSSYVEFLTETKTAMLKVRAKFNFKAKHPSELTMLRGEILLIERSVDANWVEVRLGERTGLVPSNYLELCEEEMEDTKSVITSSYTSTSTPSTPERPCLAGVITERLYRPTDLLKCKLREEFQEREKKMLDLDQLISQTMQEFCPGDVVSQSNDDGRRRNTNGMRGSLREAVVVREHRARAAGELQLAVGDSLGVIQDFQDGWMAGLEKSSGHLGLFPSSCITLL